VASVSADSRSEGEYAFCSKRVWSPTARSPNAARMTARSSSATVVTTGHLVRATQVEGKAITAFWS
jgi:hypothetical protein